MTIGTSHRLWSLFAAALLGLALPAAPAAADEAAAMYQPETVVLVHLTLPQASIEALEADPEGEYQEGFFSMAYSDGTPEGAGPFSTPIKVGIRLKGGLGSFLPLGQKSAFKVKFSYVKKQKFLGLKKMTLNNMVQDPSMLHERLSYEAFRALGVQGPRTGYAYVTLNGEPLGLYLNIEDLDDVALEHRFGTFEEPPQHLYEGEYAADVTPGGAVDFEVDEGEEDDRSDLEALIAAVNGGAPDWWAAVDPYADLEEMTRMWAVEKYIGHWDGYAGHVKEGGTFVPNNYYLFSDAAGRFQMLPWGTDQTWEDDLSFTGDASAVLFTKCEADPTCKAAYQAALAEALPRLSGAELFGAAVCAARRLHPWQVLEAKESTVPRPFSLGEIEAGVDDAEDFATARPGQLAAFLGAPTPSRAASLPCDPPPSPPTPQPPAPEPPSAGVTLGHASVAGRRLRVQVGVPGPGAVDLRGVLRTKDGEEGACGDTRRVATAAGDLVLACRLKAAALQRLRLRWLRVELRARFQPDGAAAQSASRWLRLRQRRPAGSS